MRHTRSRLLMARFAAGAMIAALVATALLSAARAQEAPPQPVLDAVIAHLAEREDVDPAAIELLRAEAVTWNNGCLGAADPGEFCTEALVPGFAVWLAVDGAAYRYHTGMEAQQFRFAEGPLPAADVAAAAIPEGGEPRDDPAPGPIEAPAGPTEPAVDGPAPAATGSGGTTAGHASSGAAAALLFALTAALVLVRTFTARAGTRSARRSRHATPPGR